MLLSRQSLGLQGPPLPCRDALSCLLNLATLTRMCFCGLPSPVTFLDPSCARDFATGARGTRRLALALASGSCRAPSASHRRRGGNDGRGGGGRGGCGGGRGGGRGGRGGVNFRGLRRKRIGLGRGLFSGGWGLCGCLRQAVQRLSGSSWHLTSRAQYSPLRKVPCIIPKGPIFPFKEYTLHHIKGPYVV